MSSSRGPKKAGSRAGSTEVSRQDSQVVAGSGAEAPRGRVALWTGLGQAFALVEEGLHGAASRFWSSPGLRWTAASIVLLVFVGVGIAFGRWSATPGALDLPSSPLVAVYPDAADDDTTPLVTTQQQESQATKPQAQPKPPTQPVKPPKADNPRTANNQSASQQSVGQQEQPAVPASGGLTLGNDAGTGADAAANARTVGNGVTGDSGTPPAILVKPSLGEITHPYGWEKSAFGDWRVSPEIVISGTPGREVYAVLDGQVSQASMDGVIIEHANGWVSHYGSLSLVRIMPGQKVTKGTVIGRAKRDLRFALYHGSDPVNPAAQFP